MKRFNHYSWPPWLRQIRAICGQVIIPITIFQAVRTIFFPTTFDVILLAIFILIAVAFHLEWF
ncbi:hypothetical protein [Parageobacillus thermoglucosidasius]|uniref:Membrane protein YszA n=3 Tax=Anoxybacillaceae TaxID=3120669 RepID=A0AAN0YQX4_PARTM|nr:hypothetical protein [Parageobacillus thermoglucosidasius]KYD13938.1 hypothetical protein B4168_0759 [Anoxybacillus flavithermus]REK55784.1 MAG: hypothetical protein C6P36_11485 [Geobacillus sp.]AEH46999.1 hypothetical protein Geoth_1001 [Parageobacillus thermoglucosidasius C56-YS93]ALF11694.1 hypothetical protein AOT13_17625 [Parageobacillus thermoglucosidasius]ANZ31777.1 hypothetical protein BCV53_17685 [Parageobacillus thermoglucosidasius]